MHGGVKNTWSHKPDPTNPSVDHFQSLCVILKAIWLARLKAPTSTLSVSLIPSTLGWSFTITCEGETNQYLNIDILATHAQLVTYLVHRPQNIFLEEPQVCNAFNYVISCVLLITLGTAPVQIHSLS